MLPVRKNPTIRFNQGRIQLLKVDINKGIIANVGPVISCGIGSISNRRFFEAKQAGVSADLLVFIPRFWAGVAENELCEFERNDVKGKKLLRIVRVQEWLESSPPCLAITLQEEREPYADNRIDSPED